MERHYAPQPVISCPHKVVCNITIPQGSTEIKIDEQGRVSNQNGEIGRIMIPKFTDVQQIKPLGNTYAVMPVLKPRKPLPTSFGMANVKPVLRCPYDEASRTFQQVQNSLQGEHERFYAKPFKPSSVKMAAKWLKRSITMINLGIQHHDMMARQMNVDTVSNNIANMTTTGYKQKAAFRDLLYQNITDWSHILECWHALPTGLQLDLVCRRAQCMVFILRAPYR